MTSYINYFGLREPPFSMTPNIDFYCNFAGQQGVVEDIVASLTEGDSFIKVTGNAGVGKTFVSRKLLVSLDQSFIVKHIYLADMTAEQLYNSLAELLSITTFNMTPSKLLRKIEAELFDLHLAGKKVVLIIDEAHSLTDDALDALRFLTNIETGSCKLMQIVLFAHTDFNSRLYSVNCAQLLQRITKSINILPLAKDEMDLYLCHRLVTAGHSSGQLFTAAAKKIIFKNSNGIPRIINILCSKSLLLSYQKGLAKVDAREIKHAIEESYDALITIQKNKCKNWLWEALLVFSLAIAVLLCWAVYNVVYLNT
jgi:MSHA biogenesis protein MshM